MKTLGKFIAVLLIMVVSSTASYAFIVSAPAVEAQLMALNTQTHSGQIENRIKWIESIQKAAETVRTGLKQVDEIKRHIEQGRQQFDFWKTHAGNWQAIIARVRTGATQIALEQGTFCSTPNMGATDLFEIDSTVQGLASAVEEAKKLMAGNQTRMTPEGLRETVTRIIGKIPETENAGVTSFAQTSIEDDMAFMGKTNKAIEELQTEKERIRRERDLKINAGMFTEAEKTQYEISENDIKNQIQTLQLQTLLRVNQQLMVANTFRAKAQNDIERRRVAENSLHQASVMFLQKSPATR